MKNLLVSEIIEFVKAKMDELSNNDDANLVSSMQSVEDLDKQILKAIVPAVTYIHLVAPNVMLTGSNEFNIQLTAASSITGVAQDDAIATPTRMEFDWEGGTQNIIIYAGAAENWTVTAQNNTMDLPFYVGRTMFYGYLPKNFMRLVSVQLSGWEIPVETLINEDSVEYNKQKNKYLQGTYKKPVAAIVHRGNDRVIELYCGRTNADTLSHGYYIPQPTIEEPIGGEKQIKVCEPLEQPCLYRIASDVMLTYGYNDKSNAMNAMAMQMLDMSSDYARMSNVNGERVLNLK